jgi:hydroxyacylglutathione hydrolase
MILRRLYDDKLAQASYLVGCAATGEALVVDPNRDVEQYVEAARGEGLRVTHVTETHIHADFVSGSRELAQRTGARLFLSAEGGEDWRYAFAEESRRDAAAGRGLVPGGERARRGAAHAGAHPGAPGLRGDGHRRRRPPHGRALGDFVFVGDVGGPDLLERAARHEGTMEAGARTLFPLAAALQGAAPDWVQLWPGHGAGSACGKALGRCRSPPWATRSCSTGGWRPRTRRSSCGRCSPGSRSRPCTSPR